MRRGSVKLIALSALCLCLLAGCAGGEGEKSATIYAMDTVMGVTAYGERAQEAVDAAVDELNRLEALLSPRRPGSDVAKVNEHPGASGAVPVCAETADLVERVLALCADTDGALDVTVYPATKAWGFADKNYRVPDDAELAALQEAVDYRRVRVYRDDVPAIDASGGELDPGAVAKGYAGDRVAELWREAGVTSGLLDLGGNIYCLGAKPDGSDWTVGVRSPEDKNALLCTLSGRDMAVVTSGAYQRNFRQDGLFYHHILDPKTCAPANSGLASVTIVAESGLLADGLSTAVYVMGLDKAGALWRARGDFEMILYTDGGALYLTAGLEGRVVPAEGLRPQVIYE